MKPNIVLFITHDQGQYIGCYDSPQTPNSLNTPNIDKLAKEGVRFTNNFSTAPLCSPSRGSIQTSKYPHQNGLMGLVNRGWTLPEYNKTLPMYLNDNGYSTHLLNLQHESRDPSTLGYDTISKFSYAPKVTERRILKFFSKLNPDDGPFYACVGTFENHIPFDRRGEPVSPDKVKVPPFLPDDIDIRKDLGEFYGSVHTVDGMVGGILKLLEEKGLKENTLFIFTTDHGIAFPRAKTTLYDPGIKTALIMNLPNQKILNKGAVIDSMVSNMDLFPTILELIGAEIPNDIAGKSFLPILKGEQKSIRSEIFAEKTYHDKYDPIRCIRTEDYKYIKNFEKMEFLFQLPDDMANMARMGKVFNEKFPELFKQSRPDEELYDLKLDPNERNNLINNPGYTKIAADLKEQLMNWMKRTKDPLLNGKIKAPEDSTIR